MTPAVHLDNGLQYARNKDYNKAVEEFSSLLEHDRAHADAFFHRGCAYLHLGDYEKAINDFNAAFSTVNLSTNLEIPLLYKRGYAYIKTNQLDSALDDFRQYLNLCKTHKKDDCIHKGLFQMGNIYTTLNQFDRAISYFDNAIAASKDTEEDKQKLYHLYRGRAYACYAKYEEARYDLSIVLKHSNNSFIKGCANNEVGQHEEALKEFDDLIAPNGNQSKLLEISPDLILFRRGLCYASLNSHGKALTDFDEALEYLTTNTSSKMNDRILFRKGMSNMALSNPHQALINFNESTNLNASQSDVYYARGMLQYTLGRYDAAVYDQRKAMSLEGKSPSLVPINKTIHHTHNYDGDHNVHIYYGNKIREAKELLKKNKGKNLAEADNHRMIAESLQKQAQYSDTPPSSLNEAREHIKTAYDLTNGAELADSVALAVNSFCRARLLADKYSNKNVPESVMKEYVQYAAESILDMSKIFNKSVIDRNLLNLLAILHNEHHKSNNQQIGNFDKYRNIYIIQQLEKAKLMEKSMKMFPNSPGQQEFYGLLVIRLFNLFDAARTASTGMFQHTLEGTLTKASWVFKLLGMIFEHVPIDIGIGKRIFGLCESGLKELDKTRIQNALNYVATRGTPTELNKIADEIAADLTIIYENQIKRFPITSEESVDDNDKKETKKSCSCSNCFKRCCHCLSRQKNRILNEAELKTMETIVEYATSLFLARFIKIDVREIQTINDIRTVFVNGVCRSPKHIALYQMALTDKIKPLDATKDDEHWNTYELFRRPVIKFQNGEIRGQKDTDENKFGWRYSSSQEEVLLKRKPEELDEYGFKKLVKIDSLS